MTTTDQSSPSPSPAYPRAVSVRHERRRLPPVRQRDLTRAMKAAKSAGFETFELVDPATGLIFRSGIGAILPSKTNDLDDELKRFEARNGG